jgi:hypothetical protein
MNLVPREAFSISTVLVPREPRQSSVTYYAISIVQYFFFALKRHMDHACIQSSAQILPIPNGPACMPDPDPTCFASPSKTSKKQQQWTAVGELLMVAVMSIYNQDAGIGAKYREFPTKMHSFKVQT